MATNDVHYVREEDGSPHDVLLCVQTSARIHDEKRMRMSDASYFLKSRSQMEDTFRPLIDLPSSAFDNSLKIAEMCDVDLEDDQYHLPDLPIPDGFNYESYLRHLTEEGLERLYGERGKSDAVQERKERELRIIHEMGFDVYFLIVADLCDFARSRNIWWNVRGSGAGSLVAYCIGITGLDPLKNTLIFERFLNPGRVSMPDFDLDYPDDQREEMIRYTVEKYGDSQVAQIVTFGRMKARAAIRDVGRAKDIALSEVDRIAKMIPGIPGKPVTIQDVLTEGHEFYNSELAEEYNKNKQVRDLLDTSMKLEGVARHSGIHAAAVIVADRELEHYTPLMRGSKSSITSTIAQYEFPILESIGLLKVDFLGLSTLSVMREAGRMIKERHGIEYNLSNIPFEDEADEAFKLLSSGEVSGVFQVESQGMRRVLTEMHPSMFEHIIAMISLYRPGPIEYIPQFIARMHGKEEVEYKHPTLEPILSETYGICVSGDAMVMDARTGRRCRLDEIENFADMMIQGVDEEWRPTAGQVTHWIDSGIKPVYQVQLRNGARIKITHDHRLLSEGGWTPLHDLAVGDHVATPHKLLGPDRQTAQSFDRRKLRVLAFLLADGSLASMASVDFVSKDQALLDEYEQCLSAFPDVRTVHTPQIRDVTRIGAAKRHELDLHYHAPTSLLTWMRLLGLKHESGSRPGGLRSHEKFIPPFVFELHESDIEFFLASLWECDGHMGRKICHYRTISEQLADDVQTLLLRIGIRSVIHRSVYHNVHHGAGDQIKVERQAYQVTVYDTAHLSNLLQPHMVSHKREAVCTGNSVSTIRREPFLAEATAATGLSARGIMDRYGVDRQHFYAKRRGVPRLSAAIAGQLVEQVEMPITAKQLNVDWQEIVSIEFIGDEHVYDLTVEGLHSFVANNIIVHNCVYQEQIIQILSQLAGYTPGEADLVRRAISKKKASEIEYHKQIFIEGCSKNDIPKSAATAIYEDIEFFARYGFNKSHAADYAVITVQTAYLKAHYPVEYMAALLLIERDKTEKVINFINECRRMGIDVLPPDVNYSGLDFDIQERPADTESLAHRDPHIGYPFPVPEDSAIRFGMAAIKNVGVGPVSVIIAAREEGGPFTGLEDFADRVDLRQVNKRALECLIKAGAFDRFGKRSQLLAVIDQMVGHSSGIHSSRESGQLSMFDALGDDAAITAMPINLPDIEEASGRERLQWEKELLGVYTISHPLQQLTIDLNGIVTCSCNDLDERYDGKNVMLAGMIAEARTITTKKGDPMAFVKLEDTQGQCEVVVFPRTYEEYKDKLVQDNVVLVKGKGQSRNGQTSLLADSIQSYVEQATSTGENVSPFQKPLLDVGPTINGVAAVFETPIDYGPDDDDDDDDDAGIEGTLNGKIESETKPSQPAKPSNGSTMNDFRPDDDTMPPMEESPFRNDVPEWIEADSVDIQLGANNAAAGTAETVIRESPEAMIEATPSTASASAAAPTSQTSQTAPEPAGQPEMVAQSANNPPAEPDSQEVELGGTAPETASKTANESKTPAVDNDSTIEEQPIEATDNGHAKSNGNSNGAGNDTGNDNENGSARTANNGTQRLTITFRRSGDLDRDKFRLKELFERIRDPRGRDQFAIKLESKGESLKLIFPDDPCTVNERLTSELVKHFRVEVSVEG